MKAEKKHSRKQRRRKIIHSLSKKKNLVQSSLSNMTMNKVNKVNENDKSPDVRYAISLIPWYDISRTTNRFERDLQAAKVLPLFVSRWYCTLFPLPHLGPRNREASIVTRQTKFLSSLVSTRTRTPLGTKAARSHSNRSLSNLRRSANITMSKHDWWTAHATRFLFSIFSTSPGAPDRGDFRRGWWFSSRIPCCLQPRQAETEPAVTSAQLERAHARNQSSPCPFANPRVNHLPRYNTCDQLIDHFAFFSAAGELDRTTEGINKVARMEDDFYLSSLSFVFILKKKKNRRLLDDSRGNKKSDRK